MSNNLYKRINYFLLSTIVIIIDQITKHIISVNNNSLINKNLIIFSLDYVKNFGAAFNIFNGSRFLLSIISILVTIFIIYLLLNNNNISKIELLSYSFILGGTIGNGIDRITKGYVIDFINLNLIDFPVFNVADISINIGLVFIAYGFIKNKR